MSLVHLAAPEPLPRRWMRSRHARLSNAVFHGACKLSGMRALVIGVLCACKNGPYE
jgi:hypothetical protein